MPMFEATGWSAALLGLYSLFVGIGALRNPTSWQTMVTEIGKSPALQLLCGLLELVVGALIYLVNPWIAADILSCLLKAGGALMMVEALLIAAFADIYTQFWLKNLNFMCRGWAAFTLVLGLVLSVAGFLRIG